MPTFCNLPQMFQDFHVLVLQQQDLIDNIERNVQRATNHIKKGTSNLNSARKHQKKSSVVRTLPWPHPLWITFFLWTHARTVTLTLLLCPSSTLPIRLRSLVLELWLLIADHGHHLSCCMRCNWSSHCGGHCWCCARRAGRYWRLFSMKNSEMKKQK